MLDAAGRVPWTAACRLRRGDVPVVGSGLGSEDERRDGHAAEKSRVLVVDDEPQITRVLRTVLSSQGTRCTRRPKASRR